MANFIKIFDNRGNQMIINTDEIFKIEGNGAEYDILFTANYHVFVDRQNAELVFRKIGISL